MLIDALEEQDSPQSKGRPRPKRQQRGGRETLLDREPGAPRSSCSLTNAPGQGLPVILRHIEDHEVPTTSGYDPTF